MMYLCVTHVQYLPSWQTLDWCFKWSDRCSSSIAVQFKKRARVKSMNTSAIIVIKVHRSMICIPLVVTLVVVQNSVTSNNSEFRMAKSRKHTYRYTYRYTNRYTCRYTYRYTNRYTYRYTNRYTYRYTYRYTHRYTYRYASRYTYRNTYRFTYRYTYRCTYRYTNRFT